MGQYISVNEMRRAPVVINERRISRVGNGVGLVVGAPCEVEWQKRIYSATVVALVVHPQYGLLVTVLDCEGTTRRVSGDLVAAVVAVVPKPPKRGKARAIDTPTPGGYGGQRTAPPTLTPIEGTPPVSPRLRRIAKLSALVLGSLLGVLAGCTGKSIELYHPESGKPIAKYNNTTDSDIGGLEARYNAATGDFDVRVKSSTQSASESNAAMWAAVEKLVSKIPVPTP